MLRTFVKQNSRKKGEKNLTIHDITVWVNEKLQMKEEEHYTDFTISSWLFKMGFKRCESKKIIYFDGHEREDVVKDRERYYKQIQELKPDMIQVDPITFDLINLDQAKFIPVYQDETVKHSNEVERFFIDDGTSNVPPPKSQGISLMSSDFMSPFGMLEYSDTAWEIVKKDPSVIEEIKLKGEYQARRAGAILQSKRDGYYNRNLCLQDFVKACKIIEANHDGRYKPVFITDNSPIHLAYAPDALVASKMNVGIGGKQPLMRKGYFYKVSANGEKILIKKVEQSMVIEKGANKGLAKGLKKVCSERFGYENIKGKNQRELTELLAAEEDFKMQKNMLQDEVEKLGGIVIFLVRFHPELSGIECAYRDLSRFLKERNIIGNSKGFEKRYEDGLKSIKIEHIRKYFVSADRFAEAYHMDGTTGDNINEVCKKLKQTKKRHRGHVDYFEERKAKRPVKKNYTLPEPETQPEQPDTSEDMSDEETWDLDDDDGLNEE